MKSVYLNTIKWSASFEDVDGSYYDHVAELYSTSKYVEDGIRNDLINQGWREIKTNNGIKVFEKERHIVRIYRLY